MRTCGWSWSTAGTESVGTGLDVPVRSTPPGTVLWRGLDAARRRVAAAGRSQPACTSARARRRSARITTGCSTSACCRRETWPSTPTATTSARDVVVSRVSGRPYQVRGSRRIVDARLPPRPYRRPRQRPTPSRTAYMPSPSRPGRLGSGTVGVRDRRIGQDSHRRLHLAARQRGRSRRDLLGRPPGSPMLNRAVVQPDPLTFLGTAGDIMEAAAVSHDCGPRVLPAGRRGGHAADRSHQSRPRWPRCRRSPDGSSTGCGRLTASSGSVTSGVEPGRLVLDEGEAAIARDAVVVHCAAPGLKYPPLVPIWTREAITLQPIRITFACSVRRWRGTSRRRSRTTLRRTGCARPRRSRIHPSIGPASRCSAAGPHPSRRIPPSGTGLMGSRSTRDGSAGFGRLGRRGR